MHSWETISLPKMVGIENYALKLEIHYLHVLKHKKMEINIDVPMNYMRMKCGVQTISEECIQCGKKEVI